MLKKILLGTLLVGLIGVLIAGAVVRTNAKAGDVNERGGRGRTAQAAETLSDDGAQYGGRWAQGETATAGSGQGGRGQGGGRSTAEAAQPLSDDGTQYGGRWAQGEDATAGRGQGGGWSTTEAVPAPQADVTAEDWLTVQGTVVSVADDLVEIETAAGEVIPFEGRPLSFAQEQGLDLQMGEKVQLSGFDEDGEFKIGQVTSLDSGVSSTLRDTSGRPGWAGRGRRS